MAKLQKNQQTKAKQQEKQLASNWFQVRNAISKQIEEMNKEHINNLLVLLR